MGKRWLASVVWCAVWMLVLYSVRRMVPAWGVWWWAGGGLVLVASVGCVVRNTWALLTYSPPLGVIPPSRRGRVRRVVLEEVDGCLVRRVILEEEER